MIVIIVALGVVGLILIMKGVAMVPQQQVWIVERFGKFEKKLEPGLCWINPLFERVSYRHSLKENAIEVPEQAGITADNVTLTLDGILYVRIIDPVAASYGVNDPVYAVTLLAQTTMRSEIGKLALDKTFEERETLNANIVTAINHAAQNWGIQCMRYEIKNISPPQSVLKAMELQMAADRQKRATILQSEGERQAQINVAEGTKQQVVLASEGAMTEKINRAKGEAEAIIAVADATAKGIAMVAESIQKQGGEGAMALRVAEQYVAAFKELAKTGTVVLLPANAADAGGMVAQALTVFDTLRHRVNTAAVPAASAAPPGSGPWSNT